MFKIIQEAEKSESGDDTLVVSSPPKPEPVKAAPLVASGSPQEGFSDRDINVKKARRAMTSGAAAAESLLQDTLRHFFSIHTVNRLLGLALAGFVAYFASSQFFLREDPADVFMKKASAMNAAALELPPDLFSVPDKDLGGVVQRNIFRPWKAAPPPSAQPSAEPSNSLVAIASTLKLSGIFLGDIPEALIEVTDEKKTYVVSKGMTIKGAQVKEVGPDAVILTDGQSEVPIR
ncbi:MAG: hypothetical protein HYT89_02285 [Candidatus Omnitrophica bacterium]|nr:hypothetical protein [Candidatus Omnitrophota bacterium]